MAKTYLVTGGSGFIGSRIVRKLVERGDKVVNLDIRPPCPETSWWLKPVAKDVVYLDGSVDSWSSVVEAVSSFRPEVIFHIAAIVNPVLLNKQPRLALRVNLEGTYNILEVCRIYGIGRLVYFSSIGVLPAVQYQPIDVKHPVFLATEGPTTNFYGASKVAEEAFCWAYHQSFGVDFIALRPSAVYGFGMQWPMFVKPMVEDSLRGKPVRFDHGRDFPRDYTHVDDVAQLAIRASDIAPEKVHDRVFFAATGQPLVTAGQVAEIVSRLIPGADIEVGPGLSDADLLEIRYRGVIDIENACQQLGYEPRYAQIEDGIQDYIQTYQRYLAEAGS